MNNVIVKSGLMLVFIILLILVAYAVYEYVQYQQGMHDDRSMTRRTIKDFDSKYKSFIKMLKAIIAQNKDNQLKLSQLSSEDTYIASQIKEKDKVIQRKISELDESLKQHGEDIENLDDEFKKLGDKIEKSKEIQGLIKTMRQKNNQLFGDLVMTSRQVTDTSSALWNAMTQVYNRYMKTTDNIEKLQKKTEENNKTKIDLVQKRLEFRGLMSSYIAEISDINRDIRDLNFHVGTQHDRFNELSQFVEINRTSIEGLYQNYNDNKSDIDRLNIELNEANLLRDQMSARLEAIRDEYTESDDLDVGDTLSDIRGFLDRVQIFVDVCKDAIEIVETANVIILQDINTLQTRIDIVNNRIDALEGKYDFLDERITELNTHNAEIESSLNEISDIHDDSRDDLTTLNEKYSTLETEIQSMQQDLSVNDTFIDNMDENMRALFNFRQNGNLITNNIQNRQFTDDNSAFDFRTHATASNGMTIGMGNTIDDNRNLRICKKESDNICLHFAMGDSGLNIMPQNVNNLIINDKNNSGLAQFDMTNNVIRMGGINESAALVLHNNTAYAKVEGIPDVPAPDLPPPPPPPPPPVVNVPDVPPPPEVNITSMAAGGSHSVVIFNRSTILGTGTAVHGQLIGTSSTRIFTIRNAYILINISQVACGGSHTVFLRTDGKVMACGYNYYCQLGDGTTTNRTYLVYVLKSGKDQSANHLSGISQVATKYYHSVFIRSDGKVMACGKNEYGQLGDGTTTNRPNPVYVLTSGTDQSANHLSGISQVAAGNSHTVFLRTDGKVMACGFGYYGRLGDGTTDSRDNPVYVLKSGTSTASSNHLSGISQVAAGYEHTVFLTTDGKVMACGNNNIGQLGIGITLVKYNPVYVLTSGKDQSANHLSGISQVSCGTRYTVFLRSDGKVMACGSGSNGSLGDGTDIHKSNPVYVLTSGTDQSANHLSGISQVAVGHYHTVFLRSDGKVMACGQNLSGQLGDGTITNRLNAIESDIENITI